MQLLLLSPNKNALVYTIKILMGSVILWFGLTALGIAEPYWALISLITVTEPDVTQARLNFKARKINTFTGTLIAVVVLVLVGSGLVALLVAVTLAVLAALMVHNYPANWRLAPTTVVVLMSAAANGNEFHEELDYALLRVAEVLAGSVVALLQALVYVRIVGWLANRSAYRRIVPGPANRIFGCSATPWYCFQPAAHAVVVVQSLVRYGCHRCTSCVTRMEHRAAKAGKPRPSAGCYTR